MGNSKKCSELNCKKTFYTKKSVANIYRQYNDFYNVQTVCCVQPILTFHVFYNGWSMFILVLFSVNLACRKCIWHLFIPKVSEHHIRTVCVQYIYKVSFYSKKYKKLEVIFCVEDNLFLCCHNTGKYIYIHIFLSRVRKDHWLKVKLRHIPGIMFL